MLEKNEMAKSINFIVKDKISWRNAGEIPPGFLQEILQLIMEPKYPISAYF